MPAMVAALWKHGPQMLNTMEKKGVDWPLLTAPEVSSSVHVLVPAHVDVQFEPHGLEFQQPVQLKLSYKGCIRPTISDFLVAYLKKK